MEDKYLKTESATQLFSRLGTKKSLNALDARFFHGISNGISPGDTIEIYGEDGCGKTELLVHLCVKCVLPNHWKTLKLSGIEAKVVFIDTDYKFPLWRMVNILEETLRNAYRNVKDTEQYQVSTMETNEFVKSCLERLFLVKCQSSFNLSKTLVFVESMVRENPDVCLIIIDSMSSFYWTDRIIGGENKLEQEFNQREIIRKLKNLQKTYHIVVIATKSAIMNLSFQMTSNSMKKLKTSNFLWKHDEYLSTEWNKLINYRYMVKKHQDDNNSNNTHYSTILLNNLSSGECKFLITDSGVEFL